MFVHRLAFDPALVTLLTRARGDARDAPRRVRRRADAASSTSAAASATSSSSPTGSSRSTQAIGLGRNPVGALAARQRLGLIQLRKTLKRSERLQRLYLNGLRPKWLRSGAPAADPDPGA